MMRWVLSTVRVGFVMRLAVMPRLFYVLPMTVLCYSKLHNKLNSIDDMVYGLNGAIRRPIMFVGHAYGIERKKKRESH